MTNFQKKVSELISGKRSNLSVGLDPALPGQVTEDSIPPEYLNGQDGTEGLVHFCLDVIDQVADSAVTIKITQPYVMGLSEKQHRTITDRIRSKGALSIYDMKLGAILRTAFAALWHSSRWGYDSVTLNPCLGDAQSSIEAAGTLKPPLGTLVNVLSSAPSVAKYVGRASIDSIGIPETIISDAKDYGADGCLFGSGKLVSDEILKLARKVLGDHSLFVCVVGNHEGEARRILRNAGKTTLINVGRDIIYSDKPRRKAEEWVLKLRKLH